MLAHSAEPSASMENAGTSMPASEGEREFMIEEYKYLQQMQSVYMTHINQAATVYVALMAALATAAAVVWGVTKGQPWDSLTILVVTVAALAASFILYERGFRGYIALCTYTQAEYRVRRYFLDHYPDIRQYVSMPASDEWPIPQPRRGGSAYWSFVLVNLLMASLVAAMLLLVTISLAPNLSLGWMAGESAIIFVVCAAVLVGTLNKRIRMYSDMHLKDIRFPLSPESQSPR